jgi:hypothetical protein
MNPDQELIAAAAAQKLGADPAAAAVPAAAPAEEQAERPTQQEMATDLVSPNTNGHKSQDEAIEEAIEFFNIDMGDGNKRQFTGQQIKGTMDRYAKLNHLHQTEVAPMKPVMKFVKEIIDGAKKEGRDVTPEQVVQFLNSAALAFTKNPTMGGDHTPSNQNDRTTRVDIKSGANTEIDGDDLSKWEDENGVSLPPGYRNAAAEMKALRDQNNQLMQMIQQVTGGNKEVASQATEALGRAEMGQITALRQMMANNLNAAQAKHQLPDESEPEFMAFAMQRGFAPEDFIDPELTMRVVGDFAATLNTPEFERLKGISARRLAFTGTAGNSPTGGGGPANPKDPNAAAFDALASAVQDKVGGMNRR